MTIFKNYRKLSNNIHASGLPRRKDIFSLVQTERINAVIDLTNRPRPIVERACFDFKIKYFKIPIDECLPNIKDFKKAVDIAKDHNVLIHCFKGIHRTGVLLHFLNAEEINPKNYIHHKKLLELCIINPMQS